MTGPSAPESRLTDCEPRKATNWRAVIAAGLVGLLTFMGVAAFLNLAPGEPSPKEEPPPPSPRLARIDARRAPPAVSLPPALLAPRAEVAEEISAPRSVTVEAPRQIAAAPVKPAIERIPAPTVVASAVAVEPRPPGQTWSMRVFHLQSLPEHVLADELRRRSTELSLDTVKDTSTKLFAQAKNAPSKEKTAPIVELLARRTDLAGLPVRGEDDCQLMGADTKAMQRMSSELRCNLQVLAQRERRPSHPYDDPDVEAAQLQSVLFNGKAWREKDGVPALVQVLQAQALTGRIVLVRVLGQIEGPAASGALARRAIFDLSPDVREAAIRALWSRPAAEYRQVFLDGLRYPVDIVAEHAAEALAALEVREAAPALVALLDLPDPAAPVRGKDNKLRVPELVRVNHLSNCLLCHAPSHDSKEPIRGLIPTPGKPVPEVRYDSTTGNFIRADVTYFRQDFSLMHAVADPGKWPAVQRFDYLIRSRELTKEEEANWRHAQETAVPREGPASYPQREAVLFALRMILGRDAGVRSEDWRELVEKERLPLK